MAEGKKGFLLYADIIHTVKKLPIEKRGELFTIILEYVNDENPKVKDVLIDLVFEPIKRQLKRDLCKYEERAIRSRENGKLGGRPKTQTNPKEPTRLNNNPDEPGKPDIVNVSDNVNVIDNDIESVINSKTHPALIGFRNNVLREAKEQGMLIDIAIKFYEYWSANHYESGKYLYQATENFTIHNKLKGWQAIEDKKQKESPKQTKNLHPSVEEIRKEIEANNKKDQDEQ